MNHILQLFGSGLAKSAAARGGASGTSAPPLEHLTPNSRPFPPRGLTLLEVLIAMFILLVGLMGVAALMPAGQIELLQAAKYDHSTTVGRAAFRDLKARGYLNPANWVDTAGTPFWSSGPINIPPSSPEHPALAIDPLGLYAPGAAHGATFPYNATGPQLTRISPNFGTNTTTAFRLADPVFRSPDDLITTPNTTKNLPPTQRMIGTSNDNSPPPGEGHRSSLGNYSWLATIATDPSPTMLASESKLVVSVAVFYKRKLSAAGAGESFSNVTFTPGASGIGGGEIQVTFSSVAQTKFPNGIKPGQWVMLAGTTSGNTVARWYRVVNADAPDPPSPPGTQYITLAGPDWNAGAMPSPTIWLFDGVIAVYEKNMRLEVR